MSIHEVHLSLPAPIHAPLVQPGSGNSAVSLSAQNPLTLSESALSHFALNLSNATSTRGRRHTVVRTAMRVCTEWNKSSAATHQPNFNSCSIDLYPELSSCNYFLNKAKQTPLGIIGKAFLNKWSHDDIPTSFQHFPSQ